MVVQVLVVLVAMVVLELAVLLGMGVTHLVGWVVDLVQVDRVVGLVDLTQAAQATLVVLGLAVPVVLGTLVAQIDRVVLETSVLVVLVDLVIFAQLDPVVAWVIPVLVGSVALVMTRVMRTLGGNHSNFVERLVYVDLPLLVIEHAFVL